MNSIHTNSRTVRTGLLDQLATGARQTRTHALTDAPTVRSSYRGAIAQPDVYLHRNARRSDVVLNLVVVLGAVVAACTALFFR